MLFHPPFKELVGLRPGPTLLVTGGMDGDEYAGIEAALRLIERYKTHDFAGRLIVIPIANVLGFKAECSHNPRDGKFPKLIFPGHPLGSSSSRLIYWISQFAKRSDAWLDLHGGALTEKVQPFMWLFETGVKRTDELARKFIDNSGAELVVFEKVTTGSKTERLARVNCAYIMSESGGRGDNSETDVERHINRAKRLMTALSMIENDAAPSEHKAQLLRRVTYVRAPCDGIWKIAPIDILNLSKSAVIGRYMRLDGSLERELQAPISGRPLWRKETMAMRKGDIILALGHD